MCIRDSTYSVQNREAVYHVIRDKNVILIEDDPYGELRFDGKTLPYLSLIHIF